MPLRHGNRAQRAERPDSRRPVWNLDQAEELRESRLPHPEAVPKRLARLPSRSKALPRVPRRLRRREVARPLQIPSVDIALRRAGGYRRLAAVLPLGAPSSVLRFAPNGGNPGKGCAGEVPE